MPLYVYTDFNRNAVEPMECLKAGWSQIKDQYWLFVGMTLVGILIGSFVPLGILMGPMMCGLYLALFQRMRGQSVEFGTLFKGFDYFGDSVVATLLHLIPMVIVMIPFYALFFLGPLLMGANSRDGEPDAAGTAGFFGLMLFLGIVMFVVLLVVTVVFTFAYPLIVERKLSGVEAVKLSVKASLANFWRLLGLLLLNGLLGVVGVRFCYVGAFLGLPLSFAAIANAYEQVFGLAPAQWAYPPPPPASFDQGFV